MQTSRMLRLAILGSLAAFGLNSTGCQNPNGSTNNTGTDALAGGALGAGAGALLGAVAHAPVAGAVIGGALGAGTGAAIGSNQDVQQNRQATATAISQAQAQALARLIQPIDVVNMTKNGLDETIIVNQIRTSGCVPLDPPNLTYLQQSGVSARVIGEMQAAAARPPAPVYVSGPPVYYGYRRPYGYYPY